MIPLTSAHRSGYDHIDERKLIDDPDLAPYVQDLHDSSTTSDSVDSVTLCT